ncbi:hypothetical protein [Flavobacterium reichenbachii]|uniref:Uncharacterized protein n=1 Tax=Flavobacterium reichenbachii TaxID=362418 RepID=A0A085ZNU4_9FLAO|nr:hypothetical protein [Flavobacterium reichenbachii]KFF06108.1 hypothetical protein IW19_11465 [Flavobacterium reichenbachii]OXB14668.1 hypothetical protein B0A68_11480 [Flavobacterium reichenbachii]
MNLNEKAITKLVCVFTLIFGLSVIFFNIKSGYKSLGLYLIPTIFVIIALLGIFKENISKWYDEKKLVPLRRWIMKHSLSVFFIFPLSVFSMIGFLLLFFALKLKWNVDLLGWITISIFAFFPLFIIYGLIFGFSISEKQQKRIAERQNKMFFDANGIRIEMPLFDKDCFISQQSIEAVIYYNYIVSSDFTEHYEGYKFYLNTIPVYTKYEKQSWLNKLFPKDSQSKIIDIDNKTKYFWEIPKMVKIYFNSKAEIDFKDPIKGTLISSETYQNKNKTTTIEKWKPSNHEAEQIVFDKFNRTLDEIKKGYR